MHQVFARKQSTPGKQCNDTTSKIKVDCVHHFCVQHSLHYEKDITCEKIIPPHILFFLYSSSLSFIWFFFIYLTFFRIK